MRRCAALALERARKAAQRERVLATPASAAASAAGGGFGAGTGAVAAAEAAARAAVAALSCRELDAALARCAAAASTVVQAAASGARAHAQDGVALQQLEALHHEASEVVSLAGGLSAWS